MLKAPARNFTHTARQGTRPNSFQKASLSCGIPLPAGMKECQQLPEPIYTPSTKAETGHDENISFEETVKLVGKERATLLRDLTLKVYSTAAKHAATRGIILADTKFEFGLMADNSIVLIDEVMTPDSSRYWPKDQYAPGRSQPSFDKQYVRDYLEQIRWNKQPPVPALPEHVVIGTRDKYLEAFRRLTGRVLL